MGILSMSPVLLFELPGTSEWIIILLVVVVFFGGKKIPELAKGIGKGIREFNDAKDGIKKDIENGMNEKSSETQKTTSAKPIDPA